MNLVRAVRLLAQPANWILLLFLVIASLWYWAGVPSVPFHPDESTYLFMSADWEKWISQPWTLAWQPEVSSPQQRYRLLDAPLNRYLLGAARWLDGEPALAVDWDWSLDWDQNRAAGALPSNRLLKDGRLGQAALFPFSLLLLYLCGFRLGGKVLGWSAMLLLATNSLVLLHTRRAMAEGGLLFTVIFFMAGLSLFTRRPWLIALPAALAFCAKQTSLPLLPLGLLAVVLYSIRPFQFRRLLKNIAFYGIAWLLITLILSPVLWAHPVEAVLASANTRLEFLRNQTALFKAVQPNGVLSDPGMAALSIIANLFNTPPAIAEAGNYLAETDPFTKVYLSNSFNGLFRDMVSGGVLLALALIGFGFAFKKCLDSNDERQIPLFLTWFSSLLLFTTLAVTITLPFQRYVILLVPFACLWVGWSVTGFVRLVRDKTGKKQGVFRRKRPENTLQIPPH